MIYLIENYPEALTAGIFLAAQVIWLGGMFWSRRKR